MQKELAHAIKESGLLTLRRIELIDRLRAIAHPATFRRILYWPTDAIRFYILDHELEQARRRTYAQINHSARMDADAR